MHKFFRLLSTILLTTVSVLPALAGTLPSRQAPENFKSYDDTGSRIVVGTVGQYGSPKQAFFAGERQFKGYFDPSPKIIKAVQNARGNVLIVAFKGSIEGDKIVGLAIVKCLQSGDSRLDITYGEPKILIPHVKELMTRMNDLDAKASGSLRTSSSSAQRNMASSQAGLNVSKYVAKSEKVSLTSATSPDKTITIGVASGFQPTIFNTSQCVLKSDDGAYLKYDVDVFALDPRSSVARSLGGSSGGAIRAMFNPDPITAWKNLNSAGAQASGQPDPDIQVAQTAPIKGGGTKASQSIGTLTINDTEYVYSNMVGLTPPNPIGIWSITLTILAAPSDKVSIDGPKLLAMLRSAHLHNQAIARGNQLGFQQLVANQRILDEQSAAISRSVASSESSAAGTYNSETENMMDSSDRATAGFCNNLRNQEVITDSEGEHGNVDNGLGDLLTNADPNEFSEVPLSGYQSGVDY